MKVDHCKLMCCATTRTFKGMVEVGTITHCNSCATDCVVGKWYGDCWPNGFASMFSGTPECPNCKGKNSWRGIQSDGLNSSGGDRYLRQCRNCHSVQAV